jgi:hypothetical protein
MNLIRTRLPLALAIAFGGATLLGILLVPGLGISLTAWASFLAAVALLLGVLNLLSVHARRVAEGNLYSGVLVVSMLIVYILAITDWLDLTEGGVRTIFDVVQVPLEAAMASMLAFFLLFSGFRLLQRQRSWWALLFIITVVLLLLAQATLPDLLSNSFSWIGDMLSEIVINAGMRGLLIGISLGIIVVSLRILTGSERPYDK